MNSNRDLIKAMLSGEGHYGKYLNNVYFATAIDTFAEMIPSWVEAMSAKAEESQRELELRLMEIKRAPPAFKED